MICMSTADRSMSRGPDPLVAVMSRLAAADARPDLKLLAEAVVDSLPQFAEARHLAVAFDPDRASLLDPQWTRRKANCLAAANGECPRWTDLPGGWNSLATAARSCGGEVVSGIGPWPGTALWNRTGAADGADAGPWYLLPLQVHNHIVGCVMLELAPGTNDETVAAAGAALTGLGRALNVVTEVWGANVALVADLDQVRGEKDSLLRLNRLQGRFVAMASHEFKTPLTSITAYTDVLRTQLTDEQFPHASEFLDVIKTEADRLLRMVNRILDFTRMEYGSQLMTRRPTNLMPLVHDTIRGLQPTIEEKALRVTVEADEELPLAEIDPDLIRQVLVNLIGNAVKFTPRGGTITVTVSETESGVAVSVADDGPGIPAADVRRIFREFYRADGETARQEGSGLGLTIARHIINLHNGHIEVRRRESGGADFRFMVPKETGAGADLPLSIVPNANPAEVRALIDELLRLIGELTGSRAVALLLRDGAGALVPVGAMGWDADGCTARPVIENEAWTRFLNEGGAVGDPRRINGELNWCPNGGDAGRRIMAPLGGGETSLGAVVAGRRRDSGEYDDNDLSQLTILADVATAALRGAGPSVGRTIEAVRLLLRIRRTGVPTSTSSALSLLAQLAQRMGVGRTGIRRLQYAAALHDAGMARVEEEIMLGGAKLEVDERDEVDRHVEQGLDLLSPLLPDDATADIIRHHHEKFDGSGYPAGLKGHAIPLGARLLAVIDAWFALTRGRPFRDGLAAADALAEIVSHAGTQFDPDAVREFQAVLAAADPLAAEPQGTRPHSL